MSVLSDLNMDRFPKASSYHSDAVLEDLHLSVPSDYAKQPMLGDINR